jgi:hypothetical protein
MALPKESYHPKKVLEFVSQLDHFDEFNPHPLIILEYGVPLKTCAYEHDRRLEGECFDSEIEFESAKKRVEKLAQEGRFSAFVVSHDRKDDDGEIYTIYDVFAPSI